MLIDRKGENMKVIIIGGGAAGMMAALSAKEQGAEVCILERQARVGRKLLATGNGRCNLSNTKLTLKNYHSYSFNPFINFVKYSGNSL